MLVLSRKLNESVTMFDAAGRQIGRVTVVDVRGGKARLGFDCPADIKLLRDELKSRDQGSGISGQGKTAVSAPPQPPTTNP